MSALPPKADIGTGFDHPAKEALLLPAQLAHARLVLRRTKAAGSGGQTKAKGIGRCSVTSPYRTREIAGHPLNHAYQVIPKQRVVLRCQRSATSTSSAERIKKNGWPRQRRARGSLQSVCVQPESLRKTYPRSRCIVLVAMRCSRHRICQRHLSY